MFWWESIQLNSSYNAQNSLRSSRFLSFSKRSRTGGKLRKSGYSLPPYFSPIFWLTPGVLLRSPAFRSLVRSPCGLKKERNRLLRRLANKIRFRLNICENVTSCFLKVSKRLSSYYVSQQLFKLEFATETKLTALNVLYCAVNI